MKAYQLSKDGFYIGPVTCQLDPLETFKQEKLVYLLPRNATFKKPPEAEINKILKFENGEWIYVDDFRGMVAYIGRKEIVIDYVGALQPDHSFTPSGEIETSAIESVSPRQIRQALTQLGLREAVEQAVAMGDQDLQDWWNFSTLFERNHQMVIGMAQTLSVTDEQLNALFTLADAL